MIYLLKTIFKKSICHPECTQACGNTCDCRQCNAVASSSCRSQAVCPICLHGNHRYTPPLITGIQTLDRLFSTLYINYQHVTWRMPRARPPPPTHVTKQLGSVSSKPSSSHCEVSSATRLEWPRQVVA